MTMLDKNDTKAMTARVDAAMDKAIAEKRIVGTVLVIGINGETVYQRAAGLLDRELGIPMREDAIFRMASCTKPIVAATILAMSDAGLLGLDDNVTDHLPDFRPQWEDKPAKITVRHLLSHSSGLSYDPLLLAAAEASPGMAGPIIPLDENVRRIGRMQLKFAPGTGWEYGVSIDVLGGLAAAINRSTLDEALQRYVTGPLGMKDTRFGVTDLSRLSACYGDGTPEPQRMGDGFFLKNKDDDGGTTFVPSRIFNPQGPQSGGGGLAGTALDFAKFMAMLQSGGGSILKRETVAEAMHNQIGTLPRREKDVGKRFGLFGAVLDDPVAAKNPGSRGTLDWGGVYGHNWIIDPAIGLTITSFSNTAVEGCNGPYREEIRDAVYGV
jgi:CubicO group peptidase (beta-lactamase class C family)